MRLVVHMTDRTRSAWWVDRDWLGWNVLWPVNIVVVLVVTGLIMWLSGSVIYRTKRVECKTV